MEKLLLPELVRQTLEEMQRVNHTELTIKEYRHRCNKILTYAEQISESFFSEEFGNRFLREVYNYPSEIPLKERTGAVKSAVRAVRKLGEYQLYGAFVRSRETKNRIDWSHGDRKIIEAYVESVQTADNSEATKKLRIHHVKLFYDFFRFPKNPKHK